VIGTRLPHRFMPAVNVNERRGPHQLSILVLHYTGMESAEKACDWLCCEESGVSCHYLVNEQGAITQMVDEAARAWHAGVSSWHGQEDVNSMSIGIEIQNPGHGPNYRDFPLQQMQAVAELCADITARHTIAPRHVLAHSDVAPGRKVDPGEKFDWAYLHKKGIGHFVEPEPITGGSFLQLGDSGDPVLALQAMLKLYGYGLATSGTFDARTRIVVEAFQRHFRPQRVDGIADASTVTTLHRLLTA
jgi:N-acetylmuramoyl-L-alanine amidase